MPTPSKAVIGFIRMGMPACCFVYLTSQGANSFERSQIRIDMPTDIEDVRSSGRTGSDRRAVKATRLTQADICQSRDVRKENADICRHADASIQSATNGSALKTKV